MKAVTEMPVLGGEATGCILHHFQAVKVIRIRANTRAHMHRAWVRATDGRRVLPKKYRCEHKQVAATRRRKHGLEIHRRPTCFLFKTLNPKHGPELHRWPTFAGWPWDLPGICAGCEARFVARSTSACTPLQRTSSGRDARPRTCGYSLAS